MNELKTMDFNDFYDLFYNKLPIVDAESALKFIDN